MEEMYYHMYQSVTLIPLTMADHGELMGPIKPSKEKENWKGQDVLITY